MTAAIDITPGQRKTLHGLLSRLIPCVLVWAYGSRVKWTARPNSDLDLVVFTTPEQHQRVSDLEEVLAESNLPFVVDVHVWDEVPERFHEIIRKEYVVLQEAGEKRVGADMAGEWEETTLGECAEWLSGGTPFKGNDAFWSGSIPWVSAKDMKSFRLHDAEDHISPLAIGNGGKLVPSGTILLLVRGMTLHNDVPICMVTREMAFNQDIKALRPAENVEGAFLAYWLLAHKPDLLASVDHAGHGTGRLVTDTLKGKPVLLPRPAEQKAIAAVLWALDDKIELNRRMNATLEAMARALFQSWFVDAAVNGLPKGWRAGTVAELATLSRAGLNPGEFPDETFDHHSIPAFDEGRVPKAEMGAAIKSNKFIVTPGCVLVSKLNPRIPRIWLPDLSGDVRAICSTEFLVAQPKSAAARAFLFNLFSCPAFTDVFATLVTGTSGSHQRVKPESLLESAIDIPPTPLVERFGECVAPMHERIHANLHQSRTLATLRDTLLPKLLSGELRVQDAKPLGEKAAA